MIVSNRRASGSVRQRTVAYRLLSRPALVMNALLPLMTHSSPTRTARVWMPAVSDPALGSVMAAAVVASPRITGLTHSSNPHFLFSRGGLFRYFLGASGGAR